MTGKQSDIASPAIWAITPRGKQLAVRISEALEGCILFLSRRIGEEKSGETCFDRLSEAVPGEFQKHAAHVFIMSTGIVVRQIGPLLVHKTRDPAVVVVDDGGQFAISLVSGHIGGANNLAHSVADIIGAVPVVTTATDASGLPAIDNIAVEKGLQIENPGAIKAVSMALLSGNRVRLHDPYGILAGTDFEKHSLVERRSLTPEADSEIADAPGVFVDDICMDLPPDILVLRPDMLTVGIGCNRGTPETEIRDLLKTVMEKYKLSRMSLKALASVDIKSDESGLLSLAETLDLPVRFYSKERLNAVETIENPSAMAEKHIGVKSVCEAAAILAAGNGPLIVPKHKTPNVTLAIARTPSTSLESDPAVPTTCP